MARKVVKKSISPEQKSEKPKSKYQNSFGSRKLFWMVAGYSGLGLILGEALIMVVQYLINWIVLSQVGTPAPVFTPEIRYGILGLFTSAGAIYGAARGMPGSSEYSHPEMPDHTVGRSFKDTESYNSQSPDEK